VQFVKIQQTNVVAYAERYFIVHKLIKKSIGTRYIDSHVKVGSKLMSKSKINFNFILNLIQRYTIILSKMNKKLKYF
jgi:hypothetical protein